eukprot:4545354-Pyramimonas_sp.AAC.1
MAGEFFKTSIGFPQLGHCTCRFNPTSQLSRRLSGIQMRTCVTGGVSSYVHRLSIGCVDQVRGKNCVALLQRPKGKPEPYDVSPTMCQHAIMWHRCLYARCHANGM